MSLLGHVYPALFFLGCGGLLLVQTHGALRRPSITAATNGGARFQFLFGGVLVAITLSGVLIEGAGGAWDNKSIFFQLAHQMTHVAFLYAGILALLESSFKVPYDTWRLALGLGFLCQAIIFYGHQLEQKEPEATLHLIMVWFSLATGLAFVISTLASSPSACLLLHIAGAYGLVVHGVWMLWIAHVMYTDTFSFAPPGTMHGDHHAVDSKPVFMISDAYVSAAFFILVTLAPCLWLFAPVGKPGTRPEDDPYSYPAFGGKRSEF